MGIQILGTGCPKCIQPPANHHESPPGADIDPGRYGLVGINSL